MPQMPHVKWSWNIRFGDVLTITILLGTMLIWGLRQEARISQNSDRITAVEQRAVERVGYIEARLDRERVRGQADLTLLRDQMQRIEDKLDRIIEAR